MLTLKVLHEDVGRDTAAQLIAEHYQHTFDLTYKYWRERNRIFGVLLLVLGLTALLSVRAQANTLLVTAMANALGVDDRPADMSALQDSIPVALVNGVAAAIVTMLIFLVYQRSRLLNLLYAYLATLEGELRGQLRLPKASFAFTRESDFYRMRPPDAFAGVLRFGYLASSGIALAGVLSLRVYQDLRAEAYWGMAVGILFGVLSLLFYVGYVKESWQGPIEAGAGRADL